MGTSGKTPPPTPSLKTRRGLYPLKSPLLFQEDALPATPHSPVSGGLAPFLSPPVSGGLALSLPSCFRRACPLSPLLF